MRSSDAFLGEAGRAGSSLSIRVDNYAALKTMVSNDYDGRLVDVKVG